MICVDNNFLVLLIKPDSNPPNHPDTGLPIDRVPERIEFFKQALNDSNETILIPDPVLGEFMMISDVETDRIFHLQRFQNSQNYQIEPFDTRAALELAAMYIREKSTLSNRKAKAMEGINETAARLKFDRQIIAIARVHKATMVYSSDRGVRAFCETHGVPITGVHELPLPPAPEPEEQPPPTLFDFLPPNEDGAGTPNEFEEDFEKLVGFTDKLEEEKTKATVEGGSGENGS